MEESSHWDMIASLAKLFESWVNWDKELEELRAITGTEEDKNNLQMEIDVIHRNTKKPHSASRLLIIIVK